MNSKHQVDRNSAIELLRIIFMMAIVLLHVYGHGSNLDYEWIYSLGNNWNTAIHLSLYSLCKLGVTGFMFISGYYGIRIDMLRLLKLALTSFFFLIVLQLIFGGRGWLLILHPWDAWWYIGAYFWICILSPFIEIAFKKLSRKEILFTIVGLLYLNYFVNFVYCRNSHDVLFLLTIYIVAHFLKSYPPKFVVKHLPKICVISIALIALLPIVVQMFCMPSIISKMILNNNNILLLVAVSSIVMLADKHPFINAYVNKIARGVLAIYLITDWKGTRNVLDTWLLPKVLDGYGFLYIPIICIVCMTIGIIVDITIARLFNKLNRNKSI